MGHSLLPSEEAPAKQPREQVRGSPSSQDSPGAAGHVEHRLAALAPEQRHQPVLVLGGAASRVADVELPDARGSAVRVLVRQPFGRDAQRAGPVDAVHHG